MSTPFAFPSSPLSRTTGSSSGRYPQLRASSGTMSRTDRRPKILGSSGSLVLLSGRASPSTVPASAFLSAAAEERSQRPRTAGTLRKQVLHLCGGAEVQLEKGNVEAAVASVSRALELDASCECAFVIRAWAKTHQGDYKGAVTDCTAALALSGDHASAFAVRAESKARLGDWPGALEDADSALKLDKLDGFTMRLRAEIMRNLGNIHAAAASHVLAQTLRKTDPVKASIKRAVLEPRDFESWLGRSEEKVRAGDFAGGVVAMGEALHFDPSCSLAWVLRAWMRQKRNDLHGAMQDCDEAVKVNPLCGLAWSVRGDIKYQTGACESALADLDEAVRVDPSSTFSVCTRALVRKHVGNHPGAIQDYTTALRLDAQDHNSYSARAGAKLSEGDYDGVVADCSQAISLNSANVMAWCHRGSAKLMKGDMEGAISDLDEALRLNPRLVQGFVIRAEAKRRQGDLESAIADCSEALRQDDKHEDAWRIRSAAKLKARDFKGAAADTQRCRQLVQGVSADWALSRLVTNGARRQPVRLTLQELTKAVRRSREQQKAEDLEAARKAQSEAAALQVKLINAELAQQVLGSSRLDDLRKAMAKARVANLLGGSDAKIRLEDNAEPTQPQLAAKFMRKVEQQWKLKAGTVLKELCENCRMPAEGEIDPDDDSSGSYPEKLDYLSMWGFCVVTKEQYGRVFDEPVPTVLSLLSFVLYTQQEVDIDRLFGFTDVPDFPEGQESPAARDKVYESYREETRRNQIRNPMMFRDANRAFFTSWAQFSEGAEDPEAMRDVSKWVKWACLITSARRRYPKARSVSRGLCGLPESLIQKFRDTPLGTEVFWPALSSTTTDPDISDSYANQAMPRERNVIFTINGVSEGLELFHLSQYPKEAEFLLPCFSLLKVTNVHRDTVPLRIDCDYMGCLMPDFFERACFQNVLQSLEEMKTKVDAAKADQEEMARKSAAAEEARRRAAAEAAAAEQARAAEEAAAAQKKAAEEEAAKKQAAEAEVARQKAMEEAAAEAARQKEADAKRAAEVEAEAARQRAMEEAAAEEARRKEADAKRAAEEEAARKQAAEEALARQREEEELLQQEAAYAKALEAEASRKNGMEEEAAAAQEDVKEEQRAKDREEETAKKRAYEELAARKRAAEEEASRKKVAEEERRRKQVAADESEQKLSADEAEARAEEQEVRKKLAIQEATRKKAVDEASRAAAEIRKKAAGEAEVAVAPPPSDENTKALARELAEKCRPTMEDQDGGEGPRWIVVGGHAKGGIMVRKGEGSDSKPIPKKLSPGSTVEEVEIKGNRFHYRRLRGDGPDRGWVDMVLDGKKLLERAD